MPAQRNYILIDYENVLPDLTLLLAETNIYVIVFVGAAQKSFPVDFAVAMQRLGSRATCVRLSGNGSNALDFHIAFYPGVLAVRDHAAYVHIISKDAGFDPLIQHLRAKRVNAYRFPDVTDIPIIKKPLSPPLLPATAHEVCSNGYTAASTSTASVTGTVAPAVNGNGAQVQAPLAPVDTDTHPAASDRSSQHSIAAPMPVDTDRQGGSSQAPQNASNPAQLSKNERIDFVIAHLQKPRITRPAKVATLRNHIHALFRKQLTDLEVDGIVIGMKRKNLISIRRSTHHLSSGRNQPIAAGVFQKAPTCPPLPGAAPARG